MLWQSLASHFGYYAILPFLPLLLTDEIGMSPASVGSTLLMFTLFLRGGSVAITEVLEGMSQRAAAVWSLLATGAAFMAVPLLARPAAVVGMLAVVGLCASVNGVAIRVLLAREAAESTGRTRSFAKLSVVVNIAAGTAPLAAGMLADAAMPMSIFLVSGGAYALSGLILLMGVRSAPSDRVADGGDGGGGGGEGGGGEGGGRPRGRAPFRLQPYLALLRNGPYRRLMAVSTAFWFLYAQNYSALPVHLDAQDGTGAAIGSVYAVVSGLIVVAQMPTTELVDRRFDGRDLMGVFRIGFFLLGGYCLLLAAVPAAAALVYAGGALFAAAIMVVVPVMDSLFSELAVGERQVTAYNARKLTWALGESVGALFGVTVQTFVIQRSGLSAYWVVLAAVAAVLAVAGHRGRRPRGSTPTAR